MNSRAANTDELDLYWVIPGVLAGMSMPWIHPKRQNNPGSSREAFDDDLPRLWKAGVRAIICLMNLRGVAELYEAAGFETLLSPIPDGRVPTREQYREIMEFIEDQRARGYPVAVHCAAGLGRTGLVLVGFLMERGADFETALKQVRAVRPGAVETREQMNFLENVG